MWCMMCMSERAMMWVWVWWERWENECRDLRRGSSLESEREMRHFLGVGRLFSGKKGWESGNTLMMSSHTRSTKMPTYFHIKNKPRQFALAHFKCIICFSSFSLFVSCPFQPITTPYFLKLLFDEWGHRKETWTLDRISQQFQELSCLDYLQLIY